MVRESASGCGDSFWILPMTISSRCFPCLMTVSISAVFRVRRFASSSGEKSEGMSMNSLSQLSDINIKIVLKI